MKTEIALAVALGALFVAVPSATPKKTPPAVLQMGVVCAANDATTPEGHDYDPCTVTVTGLVTNTTYSLQVTDNCNGFSVARNVTAVAGGINVPVQIPDCQNATFSLFTTGRNAGQLVATSGLIVMQ